MTPARPFSKSEATPTEMAETTAAEITAVEMAMVTATGTARATYLRASVRTIPDALTVETDDVKRRPRLYRERRRRIFPISINCGT